MPNTRKLLIALLTLGALTIGTAAAIDERPDSPGTGASSQELIEAARSAYEIHRKLYDNHRGPTAEDLYIWSKRWMTAEWDLSLGAHEAQKAVKDHFDRMVDIEAVAKARDVAGRGLSDVRATKYYRTEAELMLQRN
ncbi:MAG TPA: hypothetical protein VHC22_33715 [Pirellulales bacterium]|nr:hypothetical protein [Pirellulales bacterium]